MPQVRDHVRADPNHLRHLPQPRNPPRLYPPARGVLDDTHVALLQLSQTLVRYVYVVERHSC